MKQPLNNERKYWSGKFKCLYKAQKEPKYFEN